MIMYVKFFISCQIINIKLLLFYRITRDQGTFGGVLVFYELYFTATNEIARDGGDFTDAENLSIRFDKGEKTKYISITPRVDNQPEKEKTYTIRLVRLQGR